MGSGKGKQQQKRNGKNIMKIVSLQEYAEYVKANEETNKPHYGYSIASIESFDKNGKLIATALYEKIAGIVSKTYRINN